MHKKAFLIVLFFLFTLSAFSAIHDKDLFDFVLRAQISYTDNYTLLTGLSRPANPEGIPVLPLALQGQALLLFSAFCLGIESGIAGCAGAATYIIPSALLLGWTDMVIFKIGYSLPLNPVYVYNYLEKSYSPVALLTTPPNYYSVELGVLTIYYENIMFNLFVELASLIAVDTALSVNYVNMGIRVGKKPRSREMVNLGFLGMGISFF